MSVVAPLPKQDLERQFDQLSREWKAQSRFMSSSSDMAMLMPYQRIIGLGPAVLPLIFRELEREPDHWFWALAVITGANPVPAESRGNLAEMAQAWLNWARSEGISW
jgi:hypothetical protein